MAKMFPEELPRAVREHPRRRAEVALYDAFAEQLDDRWRVFYSVAWLRKQRQRGARDGEADYLLAHPDHGLLVLEAKGGRISRHASGRWTSTDRNGIEHDIKDPAEQARRCKYALMEHLNDIPLWACHGPYNCAHAVAFPDCRVPSAILCTDVRREIVVDATDMGDLRARLESIYRFWKDQHAGAEQLNAERLEVLEDVMAPRFTLPQSLVSVLRDNDAEFARLTEQQFAVLNLLKRKRRVAVSGLAGSGKTFLALERARRFAAEGFRTLLTCFNRNLAEFLRAQIGDSMPNLTVRTYHHLCAELAEEAGVPLATEAPADPEANRRHWNEDHTDALLKALERMPDRRFDALVVDEGQDFHEDWWTALQFVLQDPSDGILHIFHDDNQDIFRRSMRLDNVEDGGLLDCSLRNTQAIHRIVERRFAMGSTCKGPEGLPVEWIPAEDDRQIVSGVKRLLHRLLHEEQVPPQEIAVLTGHARERSCLGREGVIGPHKITTELGETRYPLVCVIHSFKGLDRQCVILAEMDSHVASGREEVIYVGLTRARSFLAVVGSPATLEALQNAPEATDACAGV